MSSSSPSLPNAASAHAASRRHDLDALRAFAMLLGIGLHAMLSFLPGIWPVQDTHQNELYYLPFAAIHGFRMPLFFLISGFFTALLWRRRGLSALLRQRAVRILLPLFLGTLTIVPAVNWISGKAIQSAMAQPADQDDGVGEPEDTEAEADLWTAITRGDTVALERHLAGGADVNAKNPMHGQSPLMQSVLSDQPESAMLLLENGADVQAQGQDGGTALHAAAFFGRARCVELLLQHGADPAVRNGYGQTAEETMAVDWTTTQFIASLIRLPIVREDLEAGRARAKDHFRAHGNAASPETASDPASPPGHEVAKNGTGLNVLTFLLSRISLFHHLWFLWFLCWLAAAFVVYAWVAQATGWKGCPDWMILSPARFLWLIPLTMIPQWFMGQGIPIFGPDTSSGLLPMPHVLGYYAIFFGFGALYYESDDTFGRLGRRWALTLPLALAVIYPLGLVLLHGEFGIRERFADSTWLRPAACLAQASYAWVMSFALMGLFRSVLSAEKFGVRYLSDASYWLYLTHVPLVIAAQWAVRDWPLPSPAKFILICVGVSGILLLAYQFFVRYTWIGKMLNGPRQRRRLAGLNCVETARPFGVRKPPAIP